MLKFLFGFNSIFPTKVSDNKVDTKSRVHLEKIMASMSFDAMVEFIQKHLCTNVYNTNSILRTFQFLAILPADLCRKSIDCTLQQKRKLACIL